MIDGGSQQPPPGTPQPAGSGNSGGNGPPLIATASPAAPGPGGGGSGGGDRGRLRLGDLLVDQGLISKDQLDQTLGDQKSSGKLLGELLVERGLVPALVLVQTVSRAIGLPGCVLRHGLIDPALLPLIGKEEAERLKAIPMFKLGQTLTVAMAEPQSLPAIDTLHRLTGCEIRPIFALQSNVLEYIKKYSGGGSDIDEFLTSLGERDVEVVERESVDEGPSTDLAAMVAGSPVVNLVNVAFLTAVKDKASDIHIEPDKKGTRIRYRIDGVLRDLMKAPAGMHAAIVSRVKVIGKMDIAEKRLPQEGRVRIVAEGRDIDLRVSSMPTLLGEKVVVRILDKSNLRVRLEHLGFRQGAMEAFRRTLELSHGLALVTGPTGSGKTTTLYSALDLLRGPEVNLLTVEDPVEYQLEQVNQIQVNEPIGLTFARALRSILRQDPDVIMVGEIRDHDTARVAVQAALTGHLVLATLHTNDAPGAVSRLHDMGIEPYLLSGSLNGVVAQRLARTICPSCATKYYPSERVLEDGGLADKVGRPFRKGAGCRSCHDTGFKGRVGVYEVMEVTPELRRMIHLQKATHELREQMKRHGGLTLRDEGVLIALEGKTSLEEILRVTQSDDVEELIKQASAAPGAGAVPVKPAPPVPHQPAAPSSKSPQTPTQTREAA
ncbi:MAG: type II/IV secretion system protein [Phycisphaerales bacterium]|nr:type II/IV secretion system protein [Phycisphaerales bacterium]